MHGSILNLALTPIDMKKLPVMASLLVIPMLLSTGCSSVAKESKVAYRTFDLYRDSSGQFPLEQKTDIPNNFSCFEDTSTNVAKNEAGDDVWINYELVDGDKTKELQVSSEEDMLATINNEQKSASNTVEHLFASFLCITPDLALNGELGIKYTNLSADDIVNSLK